MMSASTAAAHCRPFHSSGFHIPQITAHDIGRKLTHKSLHRGELCRISTACPRQQENLLQNRMCAFTQPFDTKIKLKNIQYKTQDSSHSVGLLLDVFPFENPFRLSAGAYYFKQKADLSTSINAINPIYEDLINQTTSTATWERLAPYVGIGWESAQQAESSLGWHASLGALYMGKARVSFQLPDVAIPKRYAGRIQAEEGSIKSKVHNYTWYPVLSLGFTYHF